MAQTIKKLKKENKLLRETCEVLADKRILSKINISLKQIKSGKFVPLSRL